MGVARPPRRKPNSASEVIRVIRIYDMLSEELTRRSPRRTLDSYDRAMEKEVKAAALAVANSIAARTED